jgi:hypothetical protein
MQTLAESLLAEPCRDALIADCSRAIEAHVSQRRGLRGIAMKTAFTVLRAGIPNLVPRVVARVLPDFLVALEPLHTRFGASSGRDFSAFLRQHENEVVQTLLGIADIKAATVNSELARGTYARFRSDAEGEVREMVPALSKIIGAHLPA